MESIILKAFNHRGTECIGLYFERNKYLQTLIQREVNGKWSRTHQCWYLPLSESNFKNIADVLRGKAILQTVELREYLLKKKKSRQSPTLPIEKKPANEIKIKEKNITSFPHHTINTDLSKENEEALQSFKQQLILKRYSPSTIRTYCNEFIQFLRILKDKPSTEITTIRIKNYMQYCTEKLKLSENTLHSKMNALKFYYEQVLGREKFFWDIPRPKKQTILPKVVSKERIADLINSIENVKHKTIIMLTYACGLRVSEVVSLKVKHIDGQRKTLFIEKGKGKKDRIVSLNPHMLIMLREYYRQYQPKDYLFEGQEENSHLSERSMQMVIQKAKLRAGIKQDGSMHMLRHSFATHLLDKGIDVVFIQKLLGHNNIKTTLRYLHVTNKDLVHILSPLDDIEGLLKK